MEKKYIIKLFSVIKKKIQNRTISNNDNLDKSDSCNFFLSENLELPENETIDSLWEYLNSYTLEGAPKDEMQAYLKEDFKRFIFTLFLIPKLNGNLLEIGSNPYYTSLLIKKFRNYKYFSTNYFGEVIKKHNSQTLVSHNKEKISFEYDNINLEKDDLPYKKSSFNIVLMCEVIEHFTNDPYFVLSNINSILEKNGYLILSTPNVSRLENVARLLAGTNIYDPYSGYGPYGRHNREYNKHELHKLLEHCGFEVEVSFTSDVHINRSGDYYDVNKFIHLVQHRNQDLGQYIFIKAKKIKEPNKLKPEWLFRSYSQDELTK